jgi:two-component system, OmpR family, response regulator
VVSRGDDEITVTPTEFAVLEVLIRRSGEVVPKAEILAHVWDANADIDPNVVEVYVGYLRRKIDVPFDRRALETVRGVGYRLAADGG